MCFCLTFVSPRRRHAGPPRGPQGAAQRGPATRARTVPRWAKKRATGSGPARARSVTFGDFWWLGCPSGRPASRARGVAAPAGGGSDTGHASPPAWSAGTPARRATGTARPPVDGARRRSHSGRRAGRCSAPRGRRSVAPDHPRPRTPRRGRHPSGLRCSAGARGRLRSRSSDTPVFTRHGFTVSAGTLRPHNPQKPRSPPLLGPPLRAGRLPFFGVRFVRFGPATGARLL